MDISAKSIVCTALDEKGSISKDIPVKSPMSTVYGSQSDEAVRIFKEMGIKPPNRILVVAPPESC